MTDPDDYVYDEDAVGHGPPHLTLDERNDWDRKIAEGEVLPEVPD